MGQFLRLSLFVCFSFFFFFLNCFSGGGRRGRRGGGPGVGGGGGGGRGGRGSGREDTEDSGEASLSCCCLSTANSKSGLTQDSSPMGEFSLTVRGPIVLLVITHTTDLPSIQREIAWVICKPSKVVLLFRFGSSFTRM